jgi:hypothetical protein
MLRSPFTRRIVLASPALMGPADSFRMRAKLATSTSRQREVDLDQHPVRLAAFPCKAEHMRREAEAERSWRIEFFARKFL